MSERAVAEFGTGLLRTRITGHADGYRWLRQPGAQAPLTRLPDPAALRTLDDLAHGVLRTDQPQALARGYAHTAPGHRSAAMALLQISDLPIGLLCRAVADLGGLLRTLHERPVAESLPPTAPGLLRLRRWFDDGNHTGTRPARLHALLGESWGSRRSILVCSWLDEVSTPMCPVHGAPGLAALVLPEQGDQVVLFAGADLATGTPALDLGWLVGELAELAAFTTAGLAPLCGRLAELAMEGYGTAAPGFHEAVSRAAVLRMVLHLHDYVAYVGWHPRVLEYGQSLAEFIDTDGQALWNHLPRFCGGTAGSTQGAE